MSELVSRFQEIGIWQAGEDLPRPRPGRFANRPYRDGGCRWAGTPRYEKARVEVWHGELARWVLLRHAPTPAGDKPPRYIDHGSGARRIG